MHLTNLRGFVYLKVDYTLEGLTLQMNVRDFIRLRLEIVQILVRIL